MTLGTTFQSGFNLADLYFVAKLGEDALAAVGMSGVMLHIIFMLAVGIMIGCTALVAQAVGSGQRERAQEVAGQSLVMSAALALLVAAVGIPFAGQLLGLLGAEAAVKEAGMPYMQIMSGCSIAMLLSVAFGAAVRGAGDAMTPLKIMAVANVVNIALDPILIFGWGGIPAMGVAGSAVATAIARVIATLWLAWVFFAGGHEQFHLGLRHLRPNWPTILRISRVGVFGSGQMLIRNISSVALVRIVALFGTAPVAAYTVGIRLFFTVLMLGMGFGNAAATIVGQNLGAGKPDRAARAGWVTAAMWTAASLVAAALLYAFAQPIVAAFNSKPNVVAMGAQFLCWIALSLPFTAMAVVLGRAMSGAGDTFWPMILVAASMLALRIPMAYGLATSWDSVGGVWVAVGVSNVLQGLLFATAFRWGRWKAIGMRLVNAAEQADTSRPQ